MRQRDTRRQDEERDGNGGEAQRIRRMQDRAVHDRGRQERPPRDPDAEREYEQFEGERGYGTRGREGFDPERDRYAEPRSREFGRGDRDFHREPDGYDDRGDDSYRSYGRGAYAQGGYRQGGYNQADHHGPRDLGQRDFGESGRTQRDYGPGNYGREGVGDGNFGHYGEAGDGTHRRDHRGRGPRGYKRSDDRIREDVCDCLMRDPQVDASDIEVKVQSGVVTLEGTVENRRVKHIAENLCESIPGVHDVTNHLRIGRQESSAEGAPARSRGAGGASSSGGGSNLQS